MVVISPLFTVIEIFCKIALSENVLLTDCKLINGLLIIHSGLTVGAATEYFDDLAFMLEVDHIAKTF